MMQRKFFGWNQPFLQQISNFLIEHYSRDGFVDLSSVLLVHSVGRASRRLIELLVENAELSAKVLIPPVLCNVGDLPERIHATANLASDNQSILLWAELLRKTKAQDLKPLIIQPPSKADIMPWISLAKQVHSLYKELSAENLTFAQVGKCCEESGFSAQVERWMVLDSLLAHYLALLRSNGLVDRFAYRSECSELAQVTYDKQIILLSTYDLNSNLKKLLSKLTCPITSLIFATDELADGFDEYGCIVPSFWLGRQIQVDDKSVIFCQGVSKQAEEVQSVLQLRAPNYTAQDIVIGMPNEELKPYIEQHLEELGLVALDSAGISLEKSELFCSLRALSTFLKSRLFFDFATFVRLSCVQTWIEKQLLEKFQEPELAREYLGVLDQYQTVHLQERISEKIIGDDAYTTKVQMLYSAVEHLIADFEGKAKSFAEWVPLIKKFVLIIFAQKPLNRFCKQENRTIEACAALAQSLHELEDFAATASWSLTASDAIDLALAGLTNLKVRPDEQGDCIEMLGWLELALDDSKLLLIPGFNEGCVPESLNADPILPNTLRRTLGLIDNERRFARDSFIFSTLLGSKDEIYLFAARTGQRGEALLPSRLLLQCEPELIARRLQKFYWAEQRQKSEVTLQIESGATALQLPKAPEKLAQPITTIPVTGFRTYIECPYKYYLQHVLKLRRFNDGLQELDALEFGNILHQVLKQFADSDTVQSHERKQIEDFLVSELENIFKRRFGSMALPAVKLQYNQLKSRLELFSIWQAQRVGQGWCTKHTELELVVPLDIGDGRSVMLKGRIDRIDFHAQAGWEVLDYKTGDGVKGVERAHRRSAKTWIDLQLPAYHYMLRTKQICEDAKLGFLLMGSGVRSNKFELANWSEQDLSQALQYMKTIAGRIVAQEFWPAQRQFGSYDDYAVLYGYEQSIR